MCFQSPWFTCCWRQRDAENSNNNNDGELSDDDSEVYWIRRRQAERRQERADRQIDRAKQRQAYISNALKTKKVVFLKNKKNKEDSKLGDKGEEEDSGHFALDDHDADGETDNNNNPNCAICLIDYQDGDEVSFSHNPKCQHYFHKPCILEWLKEDHDKCPCCRSNYLAFSDDEEESTQVNVSAVNRRRRQDAPERSTEPITGGGGDSSQFALGGGEQSNNNEPWEIRLEHTVELLRSQVEGRVETARRELREHRENHRSRQHRNATDGDNDGESSVFLEDGLEHAIALVRNQLARLRRAADREIQNRRNTGTNGTNGNGSRIRNHSTAAAAAAASSSNQEARWEDAIQVVRTRLHGIATSEPASRIRERSQQTMQTILRHASQRRSNLGS